MASIEVIDKNGNRRAYCDNADDAQREVERLEKDKPEFGPFKVLAPTKTKGTSQGKAAK